MPQLREGDVLLRQERRQYHGLQAGSEDDEGAEKKNDADLQSGRTRSDPLSLRHRSIAPVELNPGHARRTHNPLYESEGTREIELVGIVFLVRYVVDVGGNFPIFVEVKGRPQVPQPIA